MNERSRKGPLRLVLERLLMIADEPRGEDCADHRRDQGRDRDGARIVFKRAAKPEATEADIVAQTIPPAAL